jgi:predicted acetyltransferase
MSVEVRPVADEAEFQRALMQIGQYFGAESAEAWSGRFARIAPMERVLSAWDGDAMVGGTGALPFRMSVPGGSVAACGTTIVGVAPTHRRRGLLRALMRSHLDDAHERGEPIAVLWASEEGIYRRFGYGRAAYVGEVALPRERTEFDSPLELRGQLRLVEPDEALEAFPPPWEAVTRQRPGMIVRTPEWWEDRTLVDPADRRWGGGPKRFAVLERDGEAAGYAIYRHRFGFDDGSSASKLEVVEAIGVDPSAVASVWRFLLDVDWTATITASLMPPDHPLFFLLREPRRMKYRMGDGLWVRLVDVGAALAGRTYAEDGGLVVEVRDEVCPWNAGRWGLDGSRTEAAADLALDVSTLGAAYLGGLRLAALAQGGWVEELTPGAIERADGLLRHGLHPWCPEIF